MNSQSPNISKHYHEAMAYIRQACQCLSRTLASKCLACACHSHAALVQTAAQRWQVPDALSSVRVQALILFWFYITCTVHAYDICTVLELCGSLTCSCHSVSK